MKIQIINSKVLLPTGLKKVNIEIENGVLINIAQKLQKDKSANIVNAKNKIILPGFIDLHTNGIAGFDLTSGTYDGEKKSFSINKTKYVQGLEKSLKEYAKHGTTLVGFTTLETSVKKMKRIFEIIGEFKRLNKSIYNDVFHGIYMEGTFMKDKRYRGAHNPKYFFEPSIKLFNEFQKAAEGNIKVVNVVPEWGNSALKLIEYLTAKNIVCAAGHTSANGREYSAAINKGLNLAIHVLNGPSSSSFKPFNEGGALETFLRSNKMFVEIIPDGYHVDKAYLLDIIKRKGIDRCIAITDSMFITNMNNVNEFIINDVTGKVSKNGEYIHLAGEETENSLFGSVLTMDKVFANLLTWFTQPIEGIWNNIHHPLNFEDALINTSKMCSINPAKILGIFSKKDKNSKANDAFTGSIEIGKKADLVITDIVKDKKNYNLKISNVLINGNSVID